MKKIIILLLALLTFTWASEAQARTPQYHKFCIGGLPSPEELARRLDQSLAAKADGTEHLTGCIATAIQFLEAFKKGDAERTDLTLQTLSRFVREDLVPVEIDHDIKWTSSCVKGKSLGAEDVKMDCMVETVGAGVKVYKDKRTNRIVIKLDCANPGLVPAEVPPCARLIVEIPAGYDKAGVPVWGDGEDAKCHGYRRLGPDGSVNGAGPWQEFKPGCVTPQCNYSEADRMVAPLVRTAVGEMDVTPGFYEVSVATRHALDASFRIGFCLKGYVNGILTYVSLNPIVRQMDYRRETGTLIARVYAHESGLPQGVTRDSPGGLFFENGR